MGILTEDAACNLRGDIVIKVIQVIYTLDKTCDPNLMTLAQAVLEIFFSQAFFGL